MATLKYVGTPAQWDSSATAVQDLVDVDYINGLLAQNMGTASAANLYTSLLSGYAPLSFQTAAINGTTGLSGQNTTPLATSSWAASQVANYVQASTVGTANGPVPLQYATGQVNALAQINAVSTQTWPSPFWSPGSYLSGPVSVAPGNTPTPLFTCTIPSITTYSPWTLACFGSIDTQMTSSTWLLEMDSAYASAGGFATFTLFVGGVQITNLDTTPMNLTANTGATAILNALQSLTTQVSTVTVTGNPGGPFTINYLPLAGGNLTVHNNNTGAGTITVTPTGQPVITVVSSATSQTIARGYGISSDYQGPAPGEVSSQGYISASSSATGSFATIGGWAANNTQGFTTTLVNGNSLQVPQTDTATLTATVSYSNAVKGFGGTDVYTQLQIVNAVTGVPLAGQTNPSVSGGSGVVTASWNGPLNINALYAVQGVQYQVAQGTYPKNTPGNPGGTNVGVFRNGTFGVWNSGNFTLTPPSAQNTGPATILPTPMSAQTHLTGSTILTVYLGTVGNAGGAQANPLSPGLWVMPIPWS